MPDPSEQDQPEDRQVVFSATDSINDKQTGHLSKFVLAAGEHVIGRVVKRLSGIFLVILLAGLAWLGVIMLVRVVWGLIAQLLGH